MKYIIFPTLFIYTLFMAGCAGRNAAPTTESSQSEHLHSETCISDHSHDHSQEEHIHDHAEDTHSAHTHGPDYKDGEAEGIDLADEIIFPVSQAVKVGLKVEKAETSSFREIIRTSGDLLAAQGDAQIVVAPVAGVVLFPQARIAQGMQVAKGDVLFYVSSRNVAGGDAVAKAKAAYESANVIYERAVKLLPDNIVSQREYDDARREYLNAKNEWDALSAGSTDKGSAVRAPAAGYINSLMVSEGEFAEVGQTLAVVSRNVRQQLIARVQERYYAQLSKLRSANIVVANGEIVRLDERNGRLISVGRSLEAGSTLIPVTFEFDAHPAIIPGSIVEVYLLGAEREGVLTVPLSAVMESQGSYSVYEQIDDEGYMRHEIKIGASDGERIEILSGIEPGTRIVTRGAVHVKMATSSAIPHSHQH